MSREELLENYPAEEAGKMAEHMNEQAWLYLENADPESAKRWLEKTLCLAGMVPFEL